MYKLFFLIIVLLGVVCSFPLVSAACTPSGTEILDNGVDEDCDGWLGTSLDYQIRAEHPRILLTPELLTQTIERISGPSAREPYISWYELIKNREDEFQDVDLVNLALIYKVTGEQTYLERLFERRPTTGDPQPDELYAIDILWDETSDAVKLNIMQRVNANSNCWYWNSLEQSTREPSEVNWGYHSAYGTHRALAYAGLFAYDEILQNQEVQNNPETYSLFDVNNFVRIADKELSQEGYFYRIENRIAGDPTYNDALPGSFGGMYDNIGYDQSEEARSVYLLSYFLMLTGQDRYSSMLHDAYRGTFYQNMQYPYKFTYFANDQWCRRADTESHEIARIWFTQTGASQPLHDAVALTANLYQDSRMQFYFSEGRQRDLCGYAYDGMFWDLIFYDDSLEINPPSTNPTAMYFSGPGLVSMRQDWSNDALFAVFTAGEGISRRYEDANSFLLHKKTDIILNAGARIRFNIDNNKHAWYNMRNLGRNTVKVFDPQESFDIGTGGIITDLHSGRPLVRSDNFGGPVFETPISEEENCFNTEGCGGPARYDCSAYPLNVCEVANIIKFEHIPDEYTYSAGDGTESYTKKIEYSQREFLYLRPETVIVFDRVKSVDPSFRKVWTIHTVPKPSGQSEITETSNGMRRYINEEKILIEHPEINTYLDILLPVQNQVTIRGGDTVLVNQPLRSGQAITTGILDSDIPRWLELFAIGDDVEGSITISGDASEGNGVSETITFDGTYQEYVSSRATSSTGTSMTDSTQKWFVNQWAGYVLRPIVGENGDLIIRGNNENTLFVDHYDSSGVYRYIIMRPMENSYYHWKHIERISTSDMNLDNFIVSTPHYFDAENAFGDLHSFSPHTDGVDDGYRKSEDIGQWTIEVEATIPQLHDNFLHVFQLLDPEISQQETTLIQGDGVSGVLIGNKVVIFKNEPGTITQTSFDVSASGQVEVYLFNLEPESSYDYLVTGQAVTLTSGNTITSSDQGTAKIVLELDQGSTGTVTIGADLNDDSQIDLIDLSLFGKYFAFNDLRADLNGDGVVDIADFELFIGAWG